MKEHNSIPSIETVEPNSHVVRFTARPGWEQWLLLTADHHWDNPKCNRDLLARHLKEAKARDALIFSFGDTFCLMQGRYDPRGSKSDVRPEHNKSDYLDAVIKDAAQRYAEYAPNFCFVGSGNHESSIRKRLETSPLDRFAERVSTMTGHPLTVGSYGGWVRFHIHYHTGGRSESIKLNYFHGSGGGGPVTKGVIQHQRRAAFIEGADIAVSGHVHEMTTTVHTKEYTDNYDKPKTRNHVALTTGTYKEEYMGGKGWHVERGAPPKPLGSWWIRLYWAGSTQGAAFEWMPCI